MGVLSNIFCEVSAFPSKTIDVRCSSNRKLLIGIHATSKKRKYICSAHYDKQHTLAKMVDLSLHSETPSGENQNLFARLMVRTYVWIVPDWTLQQSMAKSTERQVQKIAYQGKP